MDDLGSFTLIFWGWHRYESSTCPSRSHQPMLRVCPVRSGPGARTSVRSGPVCCGATRLPCLSLVWFLLDRFWLPKLEKVIKFGWFKPFQFDISDLLVWWLWFLFDGNGLVTLKWFESFDYFFNLWQPKPVKKASKSPNQKIRIIEIEMNWISQIWLLFQSLAAKTCPKVVQVTKPEDQNYGIEMVWSQNLSKRNQNIWNRCMYSWAVSRVRSGPGPVPVRDRVGGKPGVPWMLVGGTAKCEVHRSSKRTDHSRRPQWTQVSRRKEDGGWIFPI